MKLEHGNPIADNLVSLRDKSYYTSSNLNNLYLGGVRIKDLINKHNLKLKNLKLSYLLLKPICLGQI